MLNSGKICSNYSVSESNKLTHNCVPKIDEPTKFQEQLKMCEDVTNLNEVEIK